MSLTITRPQVPVPLPLSRGGTDATTPAGARATLELGDLAQLTAPGGTSTFLRADKTWAVPPGGGGGGGDVSSSTGLSVDTELVVFDGTSGKLLKRGTGSGLARLTNGVLGTVAAPTGAVVGTTDTQTLTGKTIAGASNTLTVRDLDLAFTDVTTANVSTTAHGLTPKAPGGTTQFLRGDATWAVPPTGTSYTDEQAQDAVGAMLLDTATIALAYDDAMPSLSAMVKDASMTEAKLSLMDVTTANASTTAHGLLRKLSGTATEYLDGTGAWTTPAGGGDTLWTRTAPAIPSYYSGLLAWWRLEDASGNRLDSVSAQALVPQGTVAQITNAAGKTGQAVSFNGTAGTYLSSADSATLSAGASSFTLAAWVYYTSLPPSSPGIGIVGKGSSSVSHNGGEYHLMHGQNRFRWVIGNGSTFVDLEYSSLVPLVSTWYFVVGWYDAALDIQYLQVNNGTVVQVANAAGSYDSTFPLEVGRQVGWSGSATMQGRVDNVMFWKRTLTTQERTDLYNSGNGVDYTAGVSPALSPATVTDQLLLAATATTQERLEVDGAIKLGNALGTTDGTLRWSGTDFEGRTAGAWTSLTGPPLPLAITDGGTGATTAGTARTALGLGTMATQDASAVAVGGGTVDGLTISRALGGFVYMSPDGFRSYDRPGNNQVSYESYLNSAGGTGRYAVGCAGNAPSYFGGNVGIQNPAPGYPLDVTGLVRLNGRISVGPGAVPNHTLELRYDRSTYIGLNITPTADSGPGSAVVFGNAAGAAVGSISTTATSTAYNTTSDVRLKHAIATLAGALERVRALRPVAFRWNADDSTGHGFLAHELQQVVPEAVAGEPDAVNPDGSVKPQQVDHSKLVPWLTAACQELAAQVQVLTTRIATLEDALGA